MQRTYFITENAQRQLEAIVAYWDERNGSSRYSDRLMTAVYSALDILCRFPFAGRNTRLKGVRVKTALHRYLLVYRISSKTISLLSLVDGRQQTATRFRKP